MYVDIDAIKTSFENINSYMKSLKNDLNDIDSELTTLTSTNNWKDSSQTVYSEKIKEVAEVNDKIIEITKNISNFMDVVALNYEIANSSL